MRQGGPVAFEMALAIRVPSLRPRRLGSGPVGTGPVWVARAAAPPAPPGAAPPEPDARSPGASGLEVPGNSHPGGGSLRAAPPGPASFDLPVPGICAVLSRLKRTRAGTCKRGRGAPRVGRCRAGAAANPKATCGFHGPGRGLLTEASRPSDPTLCGIRRPPLSEEAHRSQLAVGS